MQSTTNEVAPAFQAQRYIHILASGLGVDVSSIPEDVLKQALAEGTPAGVNKIIVGWNMAKNTEPVQVLSPEDEALMRSLGSHENTSHIQQLKRDMESHLASAAARARDVQSYLVSAADKRAQIEIALGRGNDTALLAGVKEIIAKGWYKYDAVETKRINDAHMRNGAVIRQGVTLSTPMVTLTHRNSTAGVDLVVPLGPYWVDIQPGRNNIIVRPKGSAVVSGGNCHPHISSGGDVCWGNAHDAYARGMDKRDYASVLMALQHVLTMYNDESPYESLSSFARRVNPQLLTQDSEYQRYGDRCIYYRGDELPELAPEEIVNDWVEGDEDDRGETCEYDMAKVKVYRLLLKGVTPPTRVNNTYYFVKKADGTFFHLEEDYSYGMGSI